MYDNMDPNGFPGMEKPGLKGIKVLSVFSLIGCGFQILQAISGFLFAKRSLEMMQSQADQMEKVEMPSFWKAFAGDPDALLETARMNYENRLPIGILTMVAAGLCLYGVLEMRKLKKQGFNFYVIGELLPILISAVFIGTSAMQGFGFYFGLAIPLLFIILYAVRRKYMSA